jgi:hypothetical protein
MAMVMNVGYLQTRNEPVQQRLLGGFVAAGLAPVFEGYINMIKSRRKKIMPEPEERPMT